MEAQSRPAAGHSPVITQTANRTTGAFCAMELCTVESLSRSGETTLHAGCKKGRRKLAGDRRKLRRDG
eukprot:936125-Rhodomonas_salina.1